MSGRRDWVTTLLDLLAVALVAAGLIGYDWRVAAIVVGVLVLVISWLNR